MYKCKYFKIQELVSPIVYQAWGEQAWMFFNPETLKELDLIRETYGSEIIINNWLWGGNLKQCGLRSNVDEIPMTKTKNKKLYLSAHCMGKAFDLHCKKGNHKALFDLIFDMIQREKLKQFKRLEEWLYTGSWVHIDEFQSKIILFH